MADNINNNENQNPMTYPLSAGQKIPPQAMMCVYAGPDYFSGKQTLRGLMPAPEPEIPKRHGQFCQECGHAVEESDKFCRECGSKLST